MADILEDKILKATHFGKIVIGDKELTCAVLEDGTRILSSTAMFKAFDRTRGILNSEFIPSENLPVFMTSNNLKPYINKALSTGESFSVKYISKDKRILDGYKATILPTICDIFLQARQDNVLTQSQESLAFVSEVLVRSLSKIGIIALIDEATGYQEERERNELQKIFSKYISAEFLPWTERFPKEFYEEIYRLRGWDYKGKSKTPYVGKITNWLIYHRLPKGILEELKRLNPIINAETGYRRHRLHQKLSTEHGVKHLDTLVSICISMMRGFDIWDNFEQIFRKSYNIPIESTIDHPEILNNKEEIIEEVGE